MPPEWPRLHLSLRFPRCFPASCKQFGASMQTPTPSAQTAIFVAAQKQPIFKKTKPKQPLEQSISQLLPSHQGLELRLDVEQSAKLPRASDLNSSPRNKKNPRKISSSLSHTCTRADVLTEAVPLMYRYGLGCKLAH